MIADREKNTVLFCGDIAATDKNRVFFENGDVETLFTDVLPVLRSSEHVIVNLECALTERDTKIRKIGPNIKSPVQTARMLKKAGVTACGLSNNHSFDYGYSGLKDTFSALSEQNISYFGAGHNEKEACLPYFFETNGKRVAVIAVVELEYTYAIGDRPGAAPFDPFDTMVRIRDTKEQADYLVVMYHGGKEQCEYPSPRLRKACHAFCDLGADLVLCQHSHIIGTLEEYNNSTILYGQGNFHFVSFWDLPGWTTGLIVKACFEDKMSLELIPIESDGRGIRLITDGKKQKLLDALEERSRSLKDGTWLDGWKAFAYSKEDFYRSLVYHVGQSEDAELAVENFAIHLACEAHTDVWRTLFPTWHAAGTDGSFETEGEQK